MLEIETKILDFDEKGLKGSLKAKRAEFKGKYFFRRWIFDLTKNKGEDEFIRLRTDGKRVTLTYKFRKGTGLDNTEEIETGIENFDDAAKLLSKVFSGGYYQENTCEKWDFEGVEISLNLWPKIPPVLELEGDSEEKLIKVIEELGIKGKNIGNVGWSELYQRYGLDLHSFKILKF
ncbi:MAG: hypothetical protein KGH71_02675 [Candidatus Micrarchaeota archaeon]|nr:hypothetical protein [Candidatus Micrarchaeota archaeon]